MLLKGEAWETLLYITYTEDPWTQKLCLKRNPWDKNYDNKLTKSGNYENLWNGYE